MIRIKLVILERDENYITRITNAINANYSDKLELFAFTKQDTFIDFIKNNKVDIILASDTFDVNLKEIPERIQFAYFVDSPSLESLNNKKAICKFSKISLIYKEILNLYSENPVNVFNLKKDGSGETGILTFLPCNGGDGASVMAAACCLNFADRGRRVLYLNLESFGTPDIFFDAEGTFNLSDLIYSIKSRKSNIALKIESMVKKDKSGVFFFDECKVPLDLMEMTGEDIQILFDVINESNLFDYVVVDTEMALNDVILQIMQNSNRLIYVTDGSQTSNLKFKRIYSTLEIVEGQRNLSLLPKISIAYNKTNCISNKYIEEIQNINVLGWAGECIKASSAQAAHQISKMSMFDTLLI